MYTELDLILPCILASLRNLFIIFATHLVVTVKVLLRAFHSRNMQPCQCGHCMCHHTLSAACHKKKNVVRGCGAAFRHSFFQAPVRHVVAASRPNTKPRPGWLRGVQRFRDSQVFFHGCPVLCLSLYLSLSLSRPCECCIVSRLHQGCPPGEGVVLER